MIFSNAVNFECIKGSDELYTVPYISHSSVIVGNRYFRQWWKWFDGEVIKSSTQIWISQL